MMAFLQELPSFFVHVNIGSRLADDNRSPHGASRHAI
jgi:hypothetical protein